MGRGLVPSPPSKKTPVVLFQVIIVDFYLPSIKTRVCCLFPLPPNVSGMNVGMRLLSFVLLLLLSVASASADSKAITTTLTTKWADTPLLLEARYHIAQLWHSFLPFPPPVTVWQHVMDKRMPRRPTGSLLRLSSKSL